MKNVYVFCSFAVLMVIMAVSLVQVHIKLRTFTQELSDMTQLQEQEMSQQDSRMELIESSLERVHDALSALEETDTPGKVMEEAVASLKAQENEGAEQSSEVAETHEQSQQAEGYDIRLGEGVIYVYITGEREPMITLPISGVDLTEEQASDLEQGIHIQDIQQVYYLLESYSS